MARAEYKVVQESTPEKTERALNELRKREDTFDLVIEGYQVCPRPDGYKHFVLCRRLVSDS